ncbi:MAG: helix-turn-helix domain-containing protein [Lachnospiraceae bacterium]|nr:helix-turn-helix domain-containing protein [Lachnospiraceae bacterium]
MERGIGVSYHVERVRAPKAYLEAELILLNVIRGKAEVQVEDQKVSLTRGGMILINPGIAHEISAAEDTLVGKCTWTVTVLTNLLKGRHAYFYCNTASGYSRWHSELRKILETLTSVYAAADHRTESLMVGYLYKTLDCLIEHFQVQSPAAGDTGPENIDYMTQIMQYILQNLHGEISLTALAEQMFVSPSTLSRTFKKHTGLYFADYVQQLRVKEAMALLSETEGNITQIALQAGFSGSSAFSRTFKKVTGETPVEFRERILSERSDVPENAVNEEEKIREELLAIGRLSEDGKVQRLVTADLSCSSPVPLRKIWSKVINIGEVHDLTKANIQKHCLYLRDHLHFQYVRVWSVFSKKLMLTDGRTPGRYNFSLLDQALEFLLQNRMKPFLDFGRRPSMAMDADGKIVYYEDLYTSFASRQLWEEAFREVLRHMRRKFGKEEVSTWIFELSRDSRHGAEGEKCYADENFDFFTAWSFAYKCVKTEIPGAQVGGVSAMIDGDYQFLNEFYKKCAKSRCIPDFCSYLLFTYTDQYLWENGAVLEAVKKERSTELQLDKIRRLMDFTGVGASKVYLTESNNTIANRDYLNDSCFRAAFFTSEIMRIHDRADLLCVMAGSDWVSSYLDSGTVVHGGIGLLTKDTIRKPAYFVFEFLNRLGSVVIASGEGYILTRSESGNYYLLCSHFVPFDAGQYPVKADDRPDLSVLRLEGHPSQVLRFRFTGIADQGYYIVKRRILSSASGSILDEWENFQFSEDLTADDVRYLRERCIPQIRLQKHYVGIEEELAFDVEMRPEEVVLLHIYRE